MTTKIEKRALNFLTECQPCAGYTFRESGVKKFDLWVTIPNRSAKKGELKASESSFERNRDLVDGLVFNTKDEKRMFESGETVLVRVFLGDEPHSVFLVSHELLSEGGKLRREDRYVPRGTMNYSKDAVTRLTVSCAGALRASLRAPRKQEPRGQTTKGIKCLKG